MAASAEPDLLLRTPGLMRGPSRGVRDACRQAGGVPVSSSGLGLLESATGREDRVRSGQQRACLRRWMAQDDVDAGRREGVSPDERRELVKLRRRNRVLKTDVEILRRASAYFARENALPRRVPGRSISWLLTGRRCAAPWRISRLCAQHPCCCSSGGVPGPRRRLSGLPKRRWWRRRWHRGPGFGWPLCRCRVKTGPLAPSEC